MVFLKVVLLRLIVLSLREVFLRLIFLQSGTQLPNLCQSSNLFSQLKQCVHQVDDAGTLIKVVSKIVEDIQNICSPNLYTDAVDPDDITENLIASKYNLTQLKDYCLPTFIENLNASNCLNMWVYAYKLNFDELKTAAFKTLDENWKMHQNLSEFFEMMKSAPNTVLEIMNCFQKIINCQPIVLENVKPRLVGF